MAISTQNQYGVLVCCQHQYGETLQHRHRTQPTAGDKVTVWYFLQWGTWTQVGKKLCVCTNHPADPKNIKEQPDAELHHMASMEGLLL